MRVLYLASAPRAHLTGAASQTIALATAAIERGWQATIAGPGGSALERAAIGAGIPFRQVAFGPAPWQVLALRAVVRAEAPDVLHAMSTLPLVLAVPGLLVSGRRRRGGPALFVSIVVEPDSTLIYADARPRPRLTAFRNRLLLRVAPALDGVFPVSRAVRDALDAMGVGGRLTVVGAPFDLAGWLERSKAPIDLPPGRPRIGTAVGQLQRLKGVDHLVRAFARVTRTHPDAICLVAGEGGERDALERLAAQLGIADRVHLLGYLDEPAPFIAALDVYAAPSLSEGLGTATTEALALGVPVVATDVGGTREQIENGVNGLLVPPADDDALASALDRLLADSALSSRLGHAAQEDVAAHHRGRGALETTWAEYRRATGRQPDPPAESWPTP